VQLSPVRHVWIGFAVEGKDCFIQRLSAACPPNDANVVPSVCLLARTRIGSRTAGIFETTLNDVPSGAKMHSRGGAARSCAPSYPRHGQEAWKPHCRFAYQRKRQANAEVAPQSSFSAVLFGDEKQRIGGLLARIPRNAGQISLWFRLRGGGRSLLRTRLRANSPANRENNSEFSRNWAQKWPRNASIPSGLYKITRMIFQMEQGIK
jgi:hypothetical protein